MGRTLCGLLIQMQNIFNPFTAKCLPLNCEHDWLGIPGTETRNDLHLVCLLLSDVSLYVL